MIKRFWSVAGLMAMIAILASACKGGGGGGGGGGPSTPWTFAVYMAGDNNLASSGLYNLNQMEQVGSDSNVNIVVQAEFGSHYLQCDSGGVIADCPPSAAGLSTFGTSRFYVTRDTDPEVIHSQQTPISDVDMASPQALTDFIKWVATNYPAQHYALVLWNHGSGWSGLILDESHNHYMSMQELKQGLSDAGLKFDVIDFDACLMAMYEVAYTVNGNANYMVSSENVEPGDGDPYHLILADLANNPAMSAGDLAGAVVSEYYNYYHDTGESSVTKSSLDMSQFADFDAKVGQLAALLNSDLAAERSAIEAARDAAQTYEADDTHKDLSDFLLQLQSRASNPDVKAKAQELQSFIANNLVAKNMFETGSRDLFNVDQSKGIAIYIPSDAPASGPASLDNYKVFTGASHPAWVDFVATLAPASISSTPGNFAFAALWTRPGVDIDLYVQEPDGDWYAPWQGTVSPNGYFSPDSSASGEADEYYQAKDYVATGTYNLAAAMYDLAGNASETAKFYRDTGSGWVQCDSHTFTSNGETYTATGCAIAK